MKRLAFGLFVAVASIGCSTGTTNDGADSHDASMTETSSDSGMDLPGEPGTVQDTFDSATDMCACDVALDEGADPDPGDPGAFDTFDPGPETVVQDINDPGQEDAAQDAHDQGGGTDVSCVPEECDGKDNDCDGSTDEGFPNLDQDDLADCVDPDIDGDGIKNEEDGCPYVASASRVDTDMDGKGDECDCDIDDDGVPNTNPGCDPPVPEDNCTFVKNPDQADTCKDGVGDACSDDNDCDGVPASQDNCPVLYNPLQLDYDSDMIGDECDDDDDNDLDPDVTDCAPLDETIHAGAKDECNVVDDDCDGYTDECSPGEACNQVPVCEKVQADIEFRLPAAPGSLANDWVIHVDHEPGSNPNDTLGYECVAFDGSLDFPNCYDEHDGSDFMISGFDIAEALSNFPSAFAAMDLGEDVLAAADGEVVSVTDGNYDRCHLDLIAQGVSCDGYPMASNSVKLVHAGDYTTEYHHMRKNSIVVTVGQQVTCGEKLGLIGSSGYSTAPHVHFEVHDPSGQVIDPFAGPESHPESYWVQQEWDQLLPAPTCEGE